MAHTRWATHGAPTEINAHPHTDNTGHIALVHNGIIENYSVLKQMLSDKGHTFTSQTDTEVLAVLVGDIYDEMKDKNHVPVGSSLLQHAVQAALRQVDGTYGIAVICKDEPDTLIVARKGSPLIIGVGKGRIRGRVGCQRHRRAHHAGHLPQRQRDGHSQARPFPHLHHRRP